MRDGGTGRRRIGLHQLRLGDETQTGGHNVQPLATLGRQTRGAGEVGGGQEVGEGRDGLGQGAEVS